MLELVVGFIDIVWLFNEEELFLFCLVYMINVINNLIVFLLLYLEYEYFLVFFLCLKDVFFW